MKRGSTFFLRGAILAMGAIVLALCIFALPAAWMAVADEYPNHTYVFYSILLILYAAAVPFYVALYQTLRLLTYIDKNIAFSKLSVGALKTIKYCAITVSALFAAGMPFFYIWGENDDAPGVIVLGMIFTMAPLVIAVFAAVLQRLLRDAINMKAENDLTV